MIRRTDPLKVGEEMGAILIALPNCFIREGSILLLEAIRFNFPLQGISYYANSFKSEFYSPRFF